MKKRIMSFFIACAVFTAAVTGRYFQWFFVNGKELSDEAAGQQIGIVTISNDRGDILDRNGIPFTNQKTGGMILIIPADLRKYTNDTLVLLSGILRKDATQFIKKVNEVSSPFSYIVDVKRAKKIKRLKLDGIKIIYVKKRYNNAEIAAHVLGYMDGEGINGVAGLEKEYNDFLNGDNRQILTYMKDAKSRYLEGLGYNTLSAESNAGSINTSLDYNIQSALELIMDKYAKLHKDFRAGLVVTDVNTGAIVGMASRPAFERDCVADYLEDPDRALTNRAVSAFSPGSVFKIVDAFAMLEEYGTGAYFRQYKCPGSILLTDRAIFCHGGQGEGTLGLREAMAFSCNSYFINQSIILGAEKILYAARRLGLGTETGISRQGVYENSGHIPEITDIFNDGDVANLALGQGSITATPVQIAQMMGAIANGGILYKAWIVDRITDKQGVTVEEIAKEPSERIMTVEVAAYLKDLLQAVVEKGTGKSAFPDSGIGAAGKTGTAENTTGMPHGWFAGFIPADTPRYAIAVVVENGNYGSTVAAPIFKEIADELYKKALVSSED